MIEKSKTLFIFEGPDGVGKTTIAKEAARQIDAEYVHLGPFPEVTSGLARMYVEAISPAVRGARNVVLDRSWLSEKPYGDVFRGGLDRLGYRKRLIERLAMRCETTVFNIAAPWEVVRSSYAARKNIEMLDNEVQLRAVFDAYLNIVDNTDLPVFFVASCDSSGKRLDTRELVRSMIFDVQVTEFFTLSHDVNVTSAGDLSGSKVVLVGEMFPNHHDTDPLVRWPFGSLAGTGCSIWLAQRLGAAGISESDLLWVNANETTREWFTQYAENKSIVALGSGTAGRLDAIGVDAVRFPHPQTWKKFHSDEEYPLITFLKDRTK